MIYLDDAIAALRDLLAMMGTADQALVQPELQVPVLQNIASFYGSVGDVLWTMQCIREEMGAGRRR